MLKEVTARRDYPDVGIVKGQKHFVLRKPYQPIQRFKTKPKRSALSTTFWETRLWQLWEKFELDGKSGMSEQLVEDLLHDLNRIFEIAQSDPKGQTARSVITRWQIEIMMIWDSSDDIDLTATYHAILESLEEVL